MGFGYLLIGYLVAFLLHITVGAMGVGSLALLLGYGLMWTGLRSLRLFCRSFSYAEWVIYPTLGVGVYRLVEDLAALFLWDIPFLTSAETVVSWVEFCLIMVFHAALLSAIREIGMQVGLKKISSAAIRNLVIVFLYAVIYLLYWIPGLFPETARNYLTLSLTLLNLGWIICNLWLLLNCTKDIVAEGQENPEPKRYRWEFLNRIGDRFSENFQKAADSNREAIEERLRKKNVRKQEDACAQSERKRKKKKRK
ncbi:MAG: hypothetical protein IKC59_07145 [Clostridia bacterium]|nr:hypothetical protein [Clostridia bacterium]